MPCNENLQCHGQMTYLLQHHSSTGPIGKWIHLEKGGTFAKTKDISFVPWKTIFQVINFINLSNGINKSYIHKKIISKQIRSYTKYSFPTICQSEGPTWQPKEGCSSFQLPGILPSEKSYLTIVLLGIYLILTAMTLWFIICKTLKTDNWLLTYRMQSQIEDLTYTVI